MMELERYREKWIAECRKLAHERDPANQAYWLAQIAQHTLEEQDAAAAEAAICVCSDRVIDGGARSRDEMREDVVRAHAAGDRFDLAVRLTLSMETLRGQDAGRYLLVSYATDAAAARELADQIKHRYQQLRARASIAGRTAAAVDFAALSAARRDISDDRLGAEADYVRVAAYLNADRIDEARCLAPEIIVYGTRSGALTAIARHTREPGDIERAFVGFADIPRQYSRDIDIAGLEVVDLCLQQGDGPRARSLLGQFDYGWERESAIRSWCVWNFEHGTPQERDVARQFLETEVRDAVHLEEWAPTLLSDDGLPGRFDAVRTMARDQRDRMTRAVLYAMVGCASGNADDLVRADESLLYAQDANRGIAGRLNMAGWVRLHMADVLDGVST